MQNKHNNNTLSRRILKLALSFLVLLLLIPSLSAASKIQTIKIQGNVRVESDTITSYLPLRVGDPFDDVLIDQSVKDLYATGLFDDVRVEQKGSTLLIIVDENPQINKIAFEGNDKLSDARLKEEVQMRSREVYSRSKVQAVQQRILEIYRRMGFYSASVEPKIIPLSENRADLVFEINEQSKTFVNTINFIGNTAFSSNRLENVMLTKRWRWYRFFASDDVFDPDRLQGDKQALRRLYLDHGYADFHLVSSQAELSPDRKDFFLTFTLHEGERYRLGKVRILSNIPQVPLKDLYPLLDVLEEDWFSAKEIENAASNLTDYLAERGFAFAQIDPQLDRNPEDKTVDLTFVVSEGEHVYVERIEVIGNDRTRDYVIRREVPMHEGDAFNIRKLRQAERNIHNLGFFKKVDIDVQQGSSPDRARIIIRVEEQPTGEMGIAGGFSTTDGLLANVSYSERNFMGKGQLIFTDFTLARKRQEFNIGMTEPYVFGHDVSLTGNIFHIRSSRIEGYEQRTTGILFKLGYRITDHLRHILHYTLQEEDIIPEKNPSLAIKQQGGKSYTSAAGHTLVYDRRDSRIEPTSGYVLSLKNTFAGLGGTVQHVENVVTGSVYYSPVESVVANLRGEAGYLAEVAGKRVLITNSFQLGADSFRGVEYAGMGPYEANKPDIKFGGTRYWVVTAEVMFPIGLPEEFGIKGSVHGTAGTLWKPGLTAKDLGAKGADDDPVVVDNKKIRTSAGFGLSWISPFGPFQVNFTKVLNKDKHDKEQVVLIGFSTRF